MNIEIVEGILIIPECDVAVCAYKYGTPGHTGKWERESGHRDFDRREAKDLRSEIGVPLQRLSFDLVPGTVGCEAKSYSLEIKNVRRNEGTRSKIKNNQVVDRGDRAQVFGAACRSRTTWQRVAILRFVSLCQLLSERWVNTDTRRTERSMTQVTLHVFGRRELRDITQTSCWN